MTTTGVENFQVSTGRVGPELMKLMRSQAQGLKRVSLAKQVTAIKQMEGGFDVGKEGIYQAKTVIL